MAKRKTPTFIIEENVGNGHHDPSRVHRA